MIAGISVHDALLVALHEGVIEDFEQNPLGSWLLRAADGRAWLFVLVKLWGTAIVGAVLMSLYRRRARLALTVAVALATLQVCLLFYLSLG